MSKALEESIQQAVSERSKSAISRLYQSELAMTDPLVHQWLSVYMQGQHTDNEILYELVVALHRNSEVLRRELIEYHSVFGSLPKPKDTTP